jgi:peptidoglycan/xylan/chitin deacetylase (PgdA/CDA1 family)
VSGDRPPTARDTSLALIGLVLVVGVMLGWLLHDLLGRANPQAVAPTALIATVAPLPPTALIATAPTQAALPTTLPELPTALPEPPTAAPTTPLPEPPTAAPTTPPPEPPTAAPTTPPPPEPAPTSTSQDPAIVGYVGHVVAEGETLETIAANGGSTPELLTSYNRLSGPPPPGRALIVPQLAGQSSALENMPILLQRGRDDKPWVALTLDAGASAAPVPRMLQTLREHNVHITFFLTGAWIKDNPDLAKQIVADGHEIANHTFTHPDLTKLDEESIRKELADTEALMQQTTGATTRPLFRPPFGAYDQRVLRIVEAEGYLPIYWTLDSLDSVGEPKTPDFLLERITGKLTPEQLRGAIILAHCGSEPTADALPRILDRFAELGLEVKKVSEVLGP